MGIATGLARHPPTLEPRLTLFTDLDGTLLDHHGYGWEAARPALARLRQGGHRVVLVTSKTLAETTPLQQALGLSGPVVAENGAVLALPAGDRTPPGDRGGGAWAVHRTGPPYPEVRACLEALRRRRGYRFQGFGDLSDAALATRTGLAPAEAAAARTRLASEPIAWEDAPALLGPFAAELGARGLRLVRGGRFHHVLGDEADKADAVCRLVAWFEERGGCGTTVALGDAPNDGAMLAAADVAVVIPNPAGRPLTLNRGGSVLRPSRPGPAGWNQAVNQLLDALPPRQFAGRCPTPEG